MSEIMSPQGTTGTTKQANAGEHKAAPDAAAHGETINAKDVILTATEPAPAVLVLEKPDAGQTETVTWVPGEAIVARFNIDQAKITVGDGATIFTWADGAVLRVVGLELGASGIPETPVTLGDGTVVGLDDLAGLAGIAPAGGAAGPGNHGHGATDPNPGDIGLGLNDTGALPYTELFFSVPELTGDTDLLEEGEGEIIVSINSVTVTEGDPIEGGEGNDSGEFAIQSLIDDPSTTITFTVSLSAPSSVPVTVNYVVIPGTALEGIPLPQPGGPEGDYNGGDGTASDTTTQVGDNLFKLADNASTPDANFVNSQPSTGVQTGTFTFAQAGTFTIAWGTNDEGDSVCNSPLFLDNVRLNGASLDSFEGGVFTDPGFTIPGSSDVSFQGNVGDVAPTDGAGQLQLNAGSLTAAQIEALLGLPAGSLTQLSNDNFAGNGIEIATDGSVLTLTLTVAAGDVLTLDYLHVAADGNGPGLSFNDTSFFYTDAQGSFETTNPFVFGDATSVDPLSGTVTFAPGETEKTITLNIVDDDRFEPTETFTVELSDPVGAVIGSNPGTGTILDDDAVASLGIIKDVEQVEGGQVADQAGEVITYSIQVFNAGNQPLTNVVVEDAFADAGITRNTDISGDNDDVLEDGETWSFTASHTVTQAEIDNNGGGDGDLDNVATASSTETGPVSDDAVVPLDQNPSLDIQKVADAEQVADEAGEVLTYMITVANLGNQTLNNVVVTDPNADSITRGDDLAGDNDDLLEVGETWSYTASHTLTQAEIDSNGDGGEGFILNVATATSDDTPPDSDDSSIPLDQNPALNIVKEAVASIGK